MSSVDLSQHRFAARWMPMRPWGRRCQNTRGTWRPRLRRRVASVLTRSCGPRDNVQWPRFHRRLLEFTGPGCHLEPRVRTPDAELIALRFPWASRQT
eukprot:6782512-Pyramimonas_sp.AAC.1